jgi:hypothetical protein
LSETEFHKYQGICLSNRIPLIIISRGDTDPTLIGKNEESNTTSDDDSHQPPTGSSSTKLHIDPSKLKASPKTILKLVGDLFPCDVDHDSLASLTTSNSTQLYRRYIQKVSFWTYGRHSVDRLKQGYDFANSLTKILEKQSPLGVILRLKVSLVALNAYVGGCPLRHTRDLGYAVSLTRDGLPRWIPKAARSQIKIKDKNTIRMWASILNTYKGLKGSWKTPTTKTICKPTSTVDYSSLQAFSRSFWEFQTWVPRNLIYRPKKFIASLTEDQLYHISAKAGPNGTPSYGSTQIIFDLVGWLARPDGLSHILDMCDILNLNHIKTDIERILQYCRSTLPIDLAHFEPLMTHIYMDPENKMNYTFSKRSKPWFTYTLGDKSPLHALSLLERCKILLKTKSFKFTVDTKEQNLLRLALLPWTSPNQGKLSVVKEAAGKCRIIAINDFFTQQVLKPLHLWLFEICRYLPQDSTFDQEGSLTKFVQRTDMTEYFSYDLSSATDLIPYQIYKAILSPLMGTYVTDKWIQLLIDKTFKLSGIDSDPSDTSPKGTTRYTRGQPMGALSSWGLMNLGHHIINQYSCFISIIRDLQTHRHHSKYFKYIEGIDIYRIVLTSGDLIPIEKLELILPGFIHYMVKCLFIDNILPFDKYVVLGDDNVIGDSPTAKVYYDLMVSVYDVPIKLAKSYISTRLVNFANQTYFDKINISPIPFKEFLSLDGISSRIEFATRTVRRFFAKPSLYGVLRYMLNSHNWELLHAKRAMGKIYEPILPLLFIITAIKLPSFIPDWDLKIQENPTRQFSVMGALLSLTHTLYNNVVSNQSIVDWYNRIGKGENLTHPNLRKYLLYLMMVILNPYLGDPAKSINPDFTRVRSLDRLFPTKIALLGLVRLRRQETIWLDKARRSILRKAAILKEIFLKLRRIDSLSTSEVAEIIITLLSEPKLLLAMEVLERMGTEHISFDYSAYENSSAWYAKVHSIIDSDSSSDRREGEKTHEMEVTTLLLRSTERYLDRGGSLDMTPPADLKIESTTLPQETDGITVIQTGGPRPTQESTEVRHPGPQA